MSHSPDWLSMTGGSTSRCSSTTDFTGRPLCARWLRLRLGHFCGSNRSRFAYGWPVGRPRPSLRGLDVGPRDLTQEAEARGPEPTVEPSSLANTEGPFSIKEGRPLPSNSPLCAGLRSTSGTANREKSERQAIINI